MRNKLQIIGSLITASLLLFPSIAGASLTLSGTAVTSDAGLTLNGAAGSDILFGSATVAGAITVGGTSQVGTLGLGTGTAAQAINIGTGAGVVKTIAIGGTGANVITIANTQTGGSFTLGNAMTTGTITIGGASETGGITLGKSTASNTISVGSGILNSSTLQVVLIGSPSSLVATSTELIFIGSAPTNDGIEKILIGHSTDGGTGATNIYLGTSRSTSSTIVFGGHWQATDNGVTTLRITTSSVAGAGSTGKTVTASSTDTTGSLTTGSEAHTAVVVTFKGTYGSAPQCIVNAANAAAAAVTGVYVTTTTTTFTINSASSTTNDKWNWLCLESTSDQAF